MRTGAIDRPTVEKSGRGGRGNGGRAMFCFDCVAADVDARTVHFGDVERIERHAGTDDVANGIDGSNFVEVNFFDGDIVDLGFGLGETLKNG